MNKSCGIRQGSFLDELSYMKKLGFDTKKEQELWNKFCLSSKRSSKTVAIDDTKKFSTHPKQLCSDTDASITSSRRTSVSSKNSSHAINFNDLFHDNKPKERKKLHPNLTQTKQDESFHLDLGMGDSCSITPRNVEVAKPGTPVYYDESETFSNVYKTAKASNKKALPSTRRGKVTKSASLSNANRNVVTDFMFEKKFRTVVEKSLHLISDIGSVLESGINPPDGDEDEARRIVRVKEFSNRFSRNYLYPLARQLEELGVLDTHSHNLNQKLLSSYHVVLNGLQAYLNHLPTSIGSCSSDKLKSLLKHLLQLCEVHAKSIGEPVEENMDCEFLNTFKLNAELAIQKVEDRFSARSSDSALKSNTTKASVKKGPGKISQGKPRKNGMETRLSMYNIPAGCFRRDPYWRKVMQSWTKKRINVKSRYKTATYRHRPPVEKKGPESSLPSKCKLFPKKSSTTLKRTPVRTPINEDNITTLVQIEENKSRHNVTTRTVTENVNEPAAAVVDHEGVVVKLLQLVLNNNRMKAEGGGQVEKDEEKDVKVAEILERLKAGGDVEVLKTVLDALQDRKEEVEEQLKLQIVKSQSSVELGAAPKRRKEPIITVTGEKNAKLICITDDNSIIETQDAEKQLEIKPVASTETQTEITSNKKNKSTQRASKTDAVKIKRLPKTFKCLEKLSKNYAINIIQYKLDFHKHCKQNPMYKKTSDVQPWMLMAKISEEILDNALLGVAREIEVNNIVQQVYDSELQL